VAAVEIRSRRLAAANSKWCVYLEHLADGRGNEVPDYMVVEGRHPRHDRITGIAVLPVVDGRFAMLRSYRHAVGSELWEVPRGFMDAGETPAQAALRELTEETGLRCATADLIELGTYAPEASTLAARGVLFAATRCEGVPRPAQDELGLGELRFFDSAAVAELARTGEIEDAGSLIAYYRFCTLMSQQNKL
jgi:ADP-ribose pyrophosphatase